MANPSRSDVTGPPSVPVYFVPATFDSNVVGLGPTNPGQVPGQWGARLPAPIAPPAQPSISPSGCVQSPSFGTDDGGEDSVSGKKVKLLCSFGGKILPRPSDGMLRYVGGQTRIISVRKDVSFGDLVQKMVDVNGQPVVIKYQLPDEDLDALVSISCSDDLENMMDEYEKLVVERSSDGSAKLRVFLFSVSDLDSSGMVQFGDLQDGNGSQRYVEAVNGVMETGGCGITRKGSIASLASTQNSDLSGADAVDASPPPLGQDVVRDANIATLADNSGYPLLVPVAQPETLLERTTMPHPVAQQPALGFDLHQLATNFPPPPHHTPYMQSFVDPPVIYTSRPQMVATTRPVLLQPQFHDNIPATVPQQFIPDTNPVSTNPGMMPRLTTPQQMVAISSDQGYNAYRAQVPSGRVAGYGWPQAPTTQEHVPYSEGWIPHQQAVLHEHVQKIDDCAMCQKQLPHAHSDGVVQEQRDSSAATIADVNSMYRSLRLEDAARFQPVSSVVVPSQAEVAAVSRNPEVQCYPEDGVQHFIPPISHVRQEAAVGGVPFVATEPLLHELAKDYTLPVVVPQDESTGFTVAHEQVNLIDGMQGHHVISQAEILPVEQPNNDEFFYHRPQQVMGREQFLNDAFSKPALITEADVVQPLAPPTDLETVLGNSNAVSSAAASNWNGNIQESLFIDQDPWNFRQEPHYPPPRPSKLTTRKEASVPRDPFYDNQLGHEMESNAQAHILDPTNQPLNYTIKDHNSEQSESNEGSSDELIKQELQATAEGVAASVLKLSLASSADTSSDANQERELQNNSDAVIQAKLEGINVKPEKANLGFPLSDGLRSLQIIKNSDLEELRELGVGTFGTVYHGKWRGTDVAIKRINDRCFAGKPSEQERMKEDFWNEAVRLAELHHPNVVAFYGVVVDGPGGFIATVTEYMVNGSLRTAMQKNGRSLDKRKLLLIAMDAAFGMEYLHSKNIVHFDLKSDNLLVNLRDPHRPICKVGDLGLSKVKCKTLISGGVRGTLPWMAPELLNGSSSLVSEKVDVFSFGIVMWELLTGEEPYSDLHYGAIIGGIVSNTLRPPVPNNCDPDWRSLMEKCWAAEPSERPSFTKVANELRLMAGKVPPKGQSPPTNTRVQAPGV